MMNSAENPLIKPLGPFRDLPEWPELLEYDPMETFPLKPTMEERDEYLDYMSNRFAVTKNSLILASEMQSMIRAGYRERNPADPKNRRKLMKLSELEGKFDVAAPAFYPNSRCIVVGGITGMGKSASVQRVLSQYEQVVVHGANQEGRWLKHTQIVHLTVRMSHSGARSGFVDRVFFALDEVLGTNYFNENKGIKQLDSRVTKIAQLLALHSVGVLVIEEMQAENFMESQFRDDLILFFLAVLSFGVPLVVIGNPRAFERTNEHTQTDRRFLSYEPINLWPYESHTDPDWMKAIAPAYWLHQVVDESEPYDAEVAQVLWECSGGVPDYARKLVTEVQKSILRRSTKALTKEAIRQHYRQLASFKSFRTTIEGLVKQDANLLRVGRDIPVEAFERRWRENGKPSGKESSGSTPKKEKIVDQGDWQAFQKRQMSKRKAAESRRANKSRRNNALRESLDPEDLRRDEKVSAMLNKSLAELKAQIEKDKNPNGEA